MSSSLPARLTAAFADRYDIERELGRGGMATVYLGRDRKHQRRVAIKVLREELASVAASERFLREIGITARLQHPNILTLIDSGELELSASGARALYFVMPYVEGESLQQRIVRDGALPVAEAVKLLREIVDALACSHQHGVLHRDIKPANVMLSQGHALVVDFGIAKALGEGAAGDTLTATGLSLGTPSYMAPEQALGDTVDERTDIYAAGVLAFEMLTGKPPFAGSSSVMLAAHVSREAPSVTSIRADVPSALCEIVKRCMAKDPASRFPAAQSLLSALSDVEATASPIYDSPTRSRSARAAIAVSTVLLFAVAGLATMFVGERKERLVQESIPQVQQLIAVGELDSAFALMKHVDSQRSNDPFLPALWRHVAHTFVFRTEPEGARVYRASFADTTSWELLGTTPTDSVRVPTSVGRYRFELEGYRSRTLLAGGNLAGYELEFALGGASVPPVVSLMRADSPDSGMVIVRGPLVGDVEANGARLSDFMLDKQEVTNADYLTFVQQGGYRRQEFWTEPFERDGQRLQWEQAMALFVDASGLPGPATWAGGAPRPGEESLPVGGISWYEAAAYARFAGKSLPTAAHWQAAAVRSAAGYILPGSNFESTAPRRGSTFQGMSPWGLFDMAGNVREWCVNQGDSGSHVILGGGWAQDRYRFTDDFTLPSFDRAAINGIRLARYPINDPVLRVASQPISRQREAIVTGDPVSQAEFDRMKLIFDYDPTPLDVRVETRDSSHADWIREQVSYATAYGQRMNAILFVPKRYAQPYQTLVFFPGSNALFQKSSAEIDGQEFAFLLRSGRAVLYPVYHGTFERQDGRAIITSPTIAYRDAVVAWGQDLRRSIDFLEARAELDRTRIGFIGHSLGGRLAGVLLAIEPRIQASVLWVAGLSYLPTRPEVDPVNYLPRIRMPVLMLNGRYDDTFRYADSQVPFFRLLGSAPDRKQHLTYDDVHAIPPVELIRETLGWLDSYLGPVSESSNR